MNRPRLKSQIHEHTNRTVDVQATFFFVLSEWSPEQKAIEFAKDHWATKFLAPFVSRLFRGPPRRPPTGRARLSNQMFVTQDFNGFRLMVWRQGRDQKQGWPAPFVSRLNRRAQP